jgi:hypothetical protein
VDSLSADKKRWPFVSEAIEKLRLSKRMERGEIIYSSKR